MQGVREIRVISYYAAKINKKPFPARTRQTNEIEIESKVLQNIRVRLTLGANPEEESTSGTDNGGGTGSDLEGVSGSGEGGAGTVGAEGNPVG